MCTLALPVVVTQLAQITITTTDVVMAGRLSADDLAAVAMGNSLANPIIFTMMGILIAVNPITAQLYGADRIHAIGNKVWQGFWTAVMLGVIGFFVVRNAGPLLGYMDTDPAIFHKAKGYLKALAWGLPFVQFFYVLRFFNEGISLTKPAFYVTLVAIPVNAMGNYAFMYGHFGFPRLGAVGMGYSTATVWAVMLLTLTTWVIYRREYNPFHLLRFCKPSWREIREILAIGLPNGMSIFMEISLFAFVTLLISSFGSQMVASHQIAISIASITYMVPLGIAIAMTGRIGQAVGKGSNKDVRRIGLVGISLGGLVSVMLALFIILAAPFLVGLYSNERSVHRIAVQLVILAGFFQLSDGLQVCGTGALRGMKDTFVPMLVNILAYWVVGFPLGYILGITYQMGARGFWYGITAGLTTGALLHNFRFFVLSRKKKTKRDQKSLD